jgi:L-fucose isomerase-like protein
MLLKLIDVCYCYTADNVTKQLLEEQLSDWRTERHIEIFTLLSTSDVHGIVSPLLETLTNRKPTSFRDFVKRHLEQFKEKFLIHCTYFVSSSYPSFVISMYCSLHCYE